MSIKLARWFAKTGQLEKADELFLRVTTLLREDKDLIQAAGLLSLLTDAYCDLGWFEMATHLYEELRSPLLDGIVADIYRDTILSRVARNYMERNDLARAATTIENVRNGTTKASDRLELILRILSQTEVSETVLSLIDTFDESDTR